MSYPILVARYDAKHPSDLAVCMNCGEQRTLDPAEGDPMDMCLECRCGGAITFKYQEADKCPGCGALGFYSHTAVLKGACSRVCMLQAEYAAALAQQGAA